MAILFYLSFNFSISRVCISRIRKYTIFFTKINKFHHFPLSSLTPSILLTIFSECELMLTFAICCCPSVVCLSVICNAHAPYSGGCNFRQFFYSIWYLGHPVTCTENFMEIVPGEPSVGRVKPKRVAKYGNFGPIEGYISETVQDTR